MISQLYLRDPPFGAIEIVCETLMYRKSPFTFHHLLLFSQIEIMMAKQGRRVEKQT